MIFQVRTEKISLRAFLHRREVLGYPTSLCECAASSSFSLIILHCRMLVNERGALRKRLASIAPETREGLSAAANKPESSGEIARWLFRTRRLAMYDLAEAIGGACERPRRPPRKEERDTLLEVGL